MALAIVREKELGSITNLYVTPVTRLRIPGRQATALYRLAMVNFALLFLMALFVFQGAVKGSFRALLLGALLYVTATTAYGMLISAFTRTQIAALFGTAILTVLPATQFSGMMTPVSSLAGVAQIIGRGFPMTYFMPISVGAFTKGLVSPISAPISELARLRSGADRAESSAAAQAGALRRAMRNARQHLLARHEGAAQLPAATMCCWRL